MAEKDDIILGLESSCDETAGALLRGGREVLAQFVASQIDLHRQYGGVVPEVACRAHMECLLPGVKRILDEAKITPADISAIAVTNRPGLIGALLIGVTAAKALALAWEVPLIGVNHVEAHIAAARFAEPELRPPYVALVVSGGHTNVYYIPDEATYECRCQTRDDAAGEAFDKVAKILGLGFPGGPRIEKAAKTGNPKAFHWKNSCLPKTGDDFSFSGIKTGVLYAARGQENQMRGPVLLDEKGVADAAASFQRAVVHALVTRTLAVAQETGAKWIALGGGVAANGYLREEMARAAEKIGARVAIPPMNLCTDNAVMIAARGQELLAAGKIDHLGIEALARGK